MAGPQAAVWFDPPRTLPLLASASSGHSQLQVTQDTAYGIAHNGNLPPVKTRESS